MALHFRSHESSDILNLFSIFLKGAPGAQYSGIFLNFLSSCIFESFSKFRRDNRTFGVKPWKIRLQSVMPAFYVFVVRATSSPAASYWFYISIWKKRLLIQNRVFHVNIFELNFIFIQFFDDTCFKQICLAKVRYLLKNQLRRSSYMAEQNMCPSG